MINIIFHLPISLFLSEYTSFVDNFVTRKKSNAKYKIIETIKHTGLKGKTHGVHLDQKIAITYKEGKEEKTLILRMVTYYDEKGRKYEFLSNSFLELTAEEITLCYKKRWDTFALKSTSPN